jgi:LmbE family N-acetylglucosaminyl deacetylase
MLTLEQLLVLRPGEAPTSGSSKNGICPNAQGAKIEVMSFKDGFFPEQGDAIKSWFETLKGRVDPDLILTHRREDAHQDHRHVCRLTWNTFRDHCFSNTKFRNGMGIWVSLTFMYQYRLTL